MAEWMKCNGKFQGRTSYLMTVFSWSDLHTQKFH